MSGEGIHNVADDADVLTAITAVYALLVLTNTEVAGLDGDAMRGTDNAALAAVCTEARLAELAAANIPADIDTIEQEAYAIEHHIHAHEKWLGAAAVAVGETHVADRIGPSIAPFALLSGNNAFGNWVQVLGSSDTPIEAGMTLTDAHRIMVTTTDSTEAFFVQFVLGESAGIAALIAAEDFTEFGYISATNNADSGITPIISKRIATGTKVWARSICIGQNAKTVNLYVGIHEYLR